MHSGYLPFNFQRKVSRNEGAMRGSTRLTPHGSRCGTPAKLTKIFRAVYWVYYYQLKMIPGRGWVLSEETNEATSGYLQQQAPIFHWLARDFSLHFPPSSPQKFKQWRPLSHPIWQHLCLRPRRRLRQPRRWKPFQLQWQKLLISRQRSRYLLCR